MRKAFLSCALFVVLAGALPAQQGDPRGLQLRVNQLSGGSAVVGRQYAVLIAIDAYMHWTALRKPVRDAREIREILSRRYYVDEFIELYDREATKAGIVKLFDRLIGITKPEDSVLIFYAGHGLLDRISDTGFWIPVDGGTDLYEQLNWLPNAQIRGFIGRIKARHVALVSDACFAGDILNPTRGSAPAITEAYFRNAYSRVSRQVLTSGSSETVPDESAFARGLKMALEGNTSPYLDPLMLYNDVRLGVTGTTPLLGNLRDSGHQEGASFLLFLRNDTATAGAEKGGADSQGQPKLKIEQTAGSIRISVKSSARLYLDGALQGEVPADSTAVLENVAAGDHQVALLYADGEKEARPVTVEADGVLSVAFQYVPPPKQEAAPQESSSRPGGPVAIPRAAITVDGDFADWSAIAPVFQDAAGDALGSDRSVDIIACFLARDDAYLYIRIDIADDRKPTLLRPHNFKWELWTTYQLDLFISQDVFFQLGTHYDKGRGRWLTQTNRSDARTGRQLETVEGSDCRLKGSSMESRYPLAFLGEHAGQGQRHAGQVLTGFNRDGKWTIGDSAETRVLGF